MRRGHRFRIGEGAESWVRVRRRVPAIRHAVRVVDANVQNGGGPEMSAEDLASQRKWDARQNVESALPPGERIDVVSVTCVELYTPSLVTRLVSAFRALGWVHDDPFRPPFCNLGEWVPASRSGALAGSWANLAWVVDVDDPRQLGDELRAPLPAGVATIRGELHAVTPSVTALVLAFEPEESAGRALESVFEGDLESRWERRPSGSGWMSSGPTNQRADLVARERARLRESYQAWVADHLPGVFSAASDRGLPTIEAFTCAKATPFFSLDPQPLGDYRWVLDIESDWNAWESQELPGWRLSAWESRRDEPFVFRLGARRDEVIVDLDTDGEADNAGLANRLAHPLFPVSTRFAVHCLLRLYSRRLADLRDRSGRVVEESGQTVRRRDVRAVTGFLVEPSYDLPLVVEEIEAFCSDPLRYGRVGADFSPVAEWAGLGGPQSIVEYLGQSDRAHAKSLLAADERIHDDLRGLVSVISSHVNLRLSWWMMWLTFVATASAVVALIVSFRR